MLNTHFTSIATVLSITLVPVHAQESELAMRCIGISLAAIELYKVTNRSLEQYPEFQTMDLSANYSAQEAYYRSKLDIADKAGTIGPSTRRSIIGGHFRDYLSQMAELKISSNRIEDILRDREIHIARIFEKGGCHIHNPTYSPSGTFKLESITSYGGVKEVAWDSVFKFYKLACNNGQNLTIHLETGTNRFCSNRSGSRCSSDLTHAAASACR